MKESDRHLRQFVADASHELRTPIAAVAAYAELFERDVDQNAEDLPRVVSGIRTETGRMERLVTDLLALARLDEGVPLQILPTELVGLCRRSGAHRHHRRARLAGDVHRRAPGRGAGRPRPVAPGGRQSPGQRPRPHARRAPRPRCTSIRTARWPGWSSTTTGPACRPKMRPGCSSVSTGSIRPGAGPTVAPGSDSPSCRPSSSPTAAPSRPSRPPAAA